MTYTPINWQNGDTITAEKLNKMDNGWGLQKTQLFSETVTTTAGNRGNEAQLNYSSEINADILFVTFDGTEYECARVNSSNAYFYGDFSGGAPDFSEYPFFIYGNGNGNSIYTENIGTYAIAASVASIETSSSFDSAVTLADTFAVVSGTTTFQEACDAFKSGKYVYVIDNSSSGKTYRGPVILVNENAFEIKFVTTISNDASLSLSGLAASSADGVLS